MRYGSIDVMKAIGILMVILGHITRNSYLGNYIYSFHMPLFFFISGFLYNIRGDFIFHKGRSILIPYFSFSFISYLYWLLVESRFRSSAASTDYLDQFLNIFVPHQSYQFNVVLWFLPCLFLVSVFFFILHEKVKAGPLFITAGSICLYYCLSVFDLHVMLIENVLCATPFFVVGFLSKGIMRDISNFKMPICGGGITCGLNTAYCYF